jgi:hypothetical protein
VSDPILYSISERSEHEVCIIIEIRQQTFLVVTTGEPASVPLLELEGHVPVEESYERGDTSGE